ncbi:hypothetical protein B0T21DRAFT_362070, partial [Apiosordaria backusii]
MSQHEATAAQDGNLQGLSPSGEIVESGLERKGAWFRMPRLMPSMSPRSSTDSFATLASFWTSKDDESTCSRSSSPDFILGPSALATNTTRDDLPPTEHRGNITPIAHVATLFGRTCIWKSEMAKHDEQPCISARPPLEVDLPLRLPAWEDARVRGEDTSSHDRFAQKELELFEMDEPSTTIDDTTNSASDISDCDCASTEDGFWKWNESRQRFIHTDESTGEEIVCPQWF